MKLHGSPMKTFAAYMEETLGYKEGEGDAIYMRNIVDIKWPDNKV